MGLLAILALVSLLDFEDYSEMRHQTGELLSIAAMIAVVRTIIIESLFLGALWTIILRCAPTEEWADRCAKLLIWFMAVAAIVSLIPKSVMLLSLGYGWDVAE